MRAMKVLFNGTRLDPLVHAFFLIQYNLLPKRHFLFSFLCNIGSLHRWRRRLTLIIVWKRLHLCGSGRSNGNKAIVIIVIIVVAVVVIFVSLLIFAAFFTAFRLSQKLLIHLWNIKLGKRWQNIIVDLFLFLLHRCQFRILFQCCKLLHSVLTRNRQCFCMFLLLHRHFLPPMDCGGKLTKMFPAQIVRLSNDIRIVCKIIIQITHPERKLFSVPLREIL
mmetsp:Transcript_6582/g.10419  ORF Transcript_6582/g.10419 Transcript_6582/m.10419 type:complete len:220 (+) Transcript_6582:791-1450(+)